MALLKDLLGIRFYFFLGFLSKSKYVICKRPPAAAGETLHVFLLLCSLQLRWFCTEPPPGAFEMMSSVLKTVGCSRREISSLRKVWKESEPFSLLRCCWRRFWLFNSWLLDTELLGREDLHGLPSWLISKTWEVIWEGTSCFCLFLDQFSWNMPCFLDECWVCCTST